MDHLIDKDILTVPTSPSLLLDIDVALKTVQPFTYTVQTGFPQRQDVTFNFDQQTLINLKSRFEQTVDSFEKEYLALAPVGLRDKLLMPYRQKHRFFHEFFSKTTLVDENNTLKMDQLALLLTPRK